MVDMPWGLKASERRHARSAINTTLRLSTCMVLIAPLGASHASGMTTKPSYELCQLLLHPSKLHFLPLFVVLFALAGGWGCEGDFYHGRAGKAAGDGSIESVHVFGKETQTDSSKFLNFLLLVSYSY